MSGNSWRRNLSVLLVVLATGWASIVGADPLPREGALAAIAEIQGRARGSDLEMTLPGAVDRELKAGTRREIRVESRREGFLTLLHLDSNGALEIWVAANEDGGQLFPKAPRLLPDPMAAFEDEVPALIGDSTLLAIATPSPLEIHVERDANSPESRALVLQSESGKLLSGLSSDLMSKFDGSYSVARIDYRVAPSTEGTDVTAEQLVAFFATGTRGRRPDDPLPIRIHFRVDSAEIEPDAARTLNEIGKGLSQNAMKNIQFQVGGHTDDQGDGDYNYRLGADRASAVCRYLTRNFGIGSSRLQPKSFGESRPRAANRSEAGRFDNRRVEFVLVK